MQTLACQLSSTRMQLLFSFDRDTKVEKTLMKILIHFNYRLSIVMLVLLGLMYSRLFVFRDTLATLSLASVPSSMTVSVTLISANQALNNWPLAAEAYKH